MKLSCDMINWGESDDQGSVKILMEGKFTLKEGLAFMNNFRI